MYYPNLVQHLIKASTADDDLGDAVAEIAYVPHKVVLAAGAYIRACMWANEGMRSNKPRFTKMCHRLFSNESMHMHCNNGSL